MLNEPCLLESLDHEGRESVSKATAALQSVRETLCLALRELDFNLPEHLKGVASVPGKAPPSSGN